MKKNLKKVISTVVALTLSVSSFAAAFAAQFTDVADTASYAQAVDELVALGIIEGYGDGTFLPDNNITRAEVTKMIVAAIGSTAAAEAAAGQNTKFVDVDSTHWAAGFVTVGTDQAGFINGYGDGTFGPENNVTYAQVVKMLVASLGYTTYAEANGGWPGGYMSYGNSLGIVDGVKANQDTEVTRAQVAQLIDNALDVPLCMITGWETDVWGQSKPTLEVKDGYGEGYQTLLTNKHDAYKVKGRVKATSKTNPSLKAGEVTYTVTNTRNFDDENYEKGDFIDVNPVYAGESGAEDQLLTYSEALLQKNDDDEFTVLSITPLGKNKVETFKTDDLDDENKNYMKSDYKNDDGTYDIGKAILGEKYLYAYKDGSSSSVNSYKLDNSAKLYVNGVEIGGEANASNLNEFLVGNTVGEVTLIDTPDIENSQTSTDGYYDYIMVSYYVSALVDSVEEVSNGAEIYLDVYEEEMESPITLDTDDDDFSYKITLDGKAIDYKDLQEDDVIAVAYNVNNSFDDSNFYDMIVTRGTIEGRVTTYSEKEDGYQINGEYYKNALNPDDNGKTLEVGSEVTLYVDAFNRFVKSEETITNKKYAVLENVYLKTGEDVYMARLATADGTIQAIPFQTKVDATQAEKYAKICNENGLNGGKKNPIADRVVEYKVTNSSSEISSLTQISSGAVAESQEYKATASTNKIGNIRMNDATKILNASDYDKDKAYSSLSLSDLVDGSEYTAIGFDKVDSVYRFVVILDGNGGYTVNTPIAIYSQTEKRYDEANDQQVDSLVVYTASDDKTTKSQSILVADDYSLPNLTEGDVIVYKLDSDGYVDDVQVIFDSNLSTYSDFRSQVSSKLVVDGTADPTFSKWLKPIDKWVESQTSYDKDGKAEVFFGPISEKNGNDISIAEVSIDADGNEVTAENDVAEITVNSDANVYVYDYSKRSDERLAKSSVGSIRATNIPDSIKLADENGDKTIINWSNANLTNKINFAFVKTIDGDATDVFVIVAPK
jgi:hypothetical protein